MSQSRPRRCLPGVSIVANGVGVVRRAERRDQAAVAGDPRRGTGRADLEQVFRATYPRVVGVAARVLGCRDDAEDVAQEVYVSFNRSTVPTEQADGWLVVAAAHTALNHLRSGRRRVAREDVAQATAELADTVVAGEDRRRVRDALGRLPRSQAVALVLRHAGLSYAEVAAALDLSPTSVGTTVRRAESALRKELNHHAPPQ
jgi:RNA polymerase sigma factor (sigma-70 family)